MSILKTMYKKQEKGWERYKQAVQDILDNIKLLLQS